MLLLVLGLFAAVLYLGPIYPSTVQQLHLHLRLPQLSDGVSLGVAEAALLMEGGVKHSRRKGDSANTLSFEVCSGFATQRVALVSGMHTHPAPRRCPLGLASCPGGAPHSPLHGHAGLAGSPPLPLTAPTALLCRHHPGC